jgi:hypothetical protein
MANKAARCSENDQRALTVALAGTQCDRLDRSEPASTDATSRRIRRSCINTAGIERIGALRMVLQIPLF